MGSHEIACDRMRSHAFACDRMRSHEIANLMSTTVRVLENASGTRSGTESLPKVFLHDNCEQISYNFFRFLKKEEIRSGTHFTQRNVFLLFTVVVTKHVWPYFQSRFPKTSSKRVSSSSLAKIFAAIPQGLKSETWKKHVRNLFWGNGTENTARRVSSQQL